MGQKYLDTLSVHVAGLQASVKGEDVLLLDNEIGVYGVFDGAGDEPNGFVAARTAADAVRDIYRASDTPATREVALEIAKTAMGRARSAVEKSGNGATTASFLSLHTVESLGCVAWAHAGDSQIMLRKKSGVFGLVSARQSHNGLLFNALHKSRIQMYGHRDEFGLFTLLPGDRVVLCTDGIPGDREEQSISEKEYADALARPTPLVAAQALLGLSKKEDDKTVIVIDRKG